MKRARTRVLWTVKPSSDVWRRSTSSSRQAVSCDGVSRWFFSTERVKGMINDVVLSNLVKTPYGLVRQTRGVPQGSILSSMLCNLYFGTFDGEKNSWKELDDGVDLLLRLVDDYCLLTPDAARAQRFVATMHSKDEEWGAEVNVDKTKTSLNQQDCWVPWCGILFHFPSGRLRVNFEKTLNNVAVPIESSRGGLARMMRAALGVKLHPLFLDPLFQSPTECAINICQILVVCAKRYHMWVSKRHARPKFVGLRAVVELFEYCFALAKARCDTKCHRPFALSLGLVKCLGGLAFFFALKKKPGRHVASGVLNKMLIIAKPGVRAAKAVGVDWTAVKDAIENMSLGL